MNVIRRIMVTLPLITVLLLLVFACAKSENDESTADHDDSNAVASHDEAPSDDDHMNDDHTDDEGHTDEEDEPGHEAHTNDENLVVLTPEAAARIEIQTAPAEKRVLAQELVTTGQVDFDQTRLAHVSPRVTGRVHRVHGVLGQRVRRGATLAEIDSIELGQAKAAYLQAKAKTELARTSFDRAQGLFADRIASEQEVLEAEAHHRDAAASLRTAEETLYLFGLAKETVDSLNYDDRGTSTYPLRAPFAGTLVERHATLGELVTPERNLFTLADLSRVWIWIDISQRDLGGVHIGDQAFARVDAFPSDVFTGTVSFLSARVDTETRTLRARLDVPNPEGKLRPGMFVEVQLVDPHAQAGDGLRAASLVIPLAALVRQGDASFVFVEQAKHEYQRRAVQLGRTVGDNVEILAGLEPGEPVVVKGAFLLKSALSKESLGGSHDH